MYQNKRTKILTLTIKRMETINDKIYFESDAEFEDFCIAPYATIEQAASGPYVEGDYSERLIVDTL